MRYTARKESSIRSYPRNSDKEFPPLNNSVVVRSVGTVKEILQDLQIEYYFQLKKHNKTQRHGMHLVPQ